MVCRTLAHDVVHHTLGEALQKLADAAVGGGERLLDARQGSGQAFWGRETPFVMIDQFFHFLRGGRGPRGVSGPLFIHLYINYY